MKIKQIVLFSVLALLGGVVGGFLSAWLPGVAVAKTNVEKVIRAEKFELVDERGRHRGSFYTAGDWATTFIIRREDSDSKIMMLAGPDSASLSIFNQGSHGMLLKSDDNGVRIELRDKDGNTRLVIGRTELKNTKTGSTEIRATGSIVIFDEKGKVVYSVP